MLRMTRWSISNLGGAVVTRAPAALACAVAANSASVVAEQRWHIYTRSFGRWAALAHATLIVPPWIGFLAALRTLPKDDLAVRGELSCRIGVALELAGLLLVISGFREVGVGAAINLDQFQPPSRPTGSGIYRVLDDPIYTGYATATMGWALRRGSSSGLVLAGLMYLLLTRVQSPIEAHGGVQAGAAEASAVNSPIHE